MKASKIIIVMLILSLNIKMEINSATLYVAKSGVIYNTINSALANASPGDIIEIIDNGVYEEQIVIKSNKITLRGGTNNMPTIQWTNWGSVITNYGMNVTIENIIISVAGSASNGIQIYSSSNIIKNCEIIGENAVGSGIYIDYVKGNIISFCKISGFNSTGDYGICFIADTNHIFYNVIYDCYYGVGISSGGNMWLNIFNNTVVKCSNGIDVNLSPFSGGNLIIKNNIFYYNTNDLYLSVNSGTLTALIEHNCYGTIETNNSSGTFILSKIDNIHYEPGFVDFANNDFHLTPDSPCIDRGIYIDYETIYKMSIPTYNSRDIGAYEYFPPPPPPGWPGTPSASKYIRLTSNNFTVGEEITIYIVNLIKISKDYVSLKAELFDLIGRKIKTLYDGTVSSDQIPALKWNGKDKNNNYVGAGVYILKVQLNNITTTEKIFFVP